METLYDDPFIEIKIGILDDSIEIIGKNEIDNIDVFKEVLVEIEQEVADYNFKNIVFVLDKIKYFPDENLIKNGFLPDISRLGVKKLAVVVGKDKKFETFYREFINSLKLIEGNLDIKIVIYSDIDSARKWIRNKPYIQTGKLLNFMLIN